MGRLVGDCPQKHNEIVLFNKNVDVSKVMKEISGSR